ncbi:MAG: hypothetical protein HN383_06890 [Verrucomicrobia bacterium]|nr:hypothetical protein [Verrucomicrobiota bacterium]
MIRTVCLVVAMVMCTDGALAARRAAPPVVPLTEAGQKLEAQYSGQLKALQAELQKAIPTVDAQKKSACLEARAFEKTAETDRNTKQKALGKIGRAAGSVNHAKGKWIGGAEKGIVSSTEKLKNATTDAERDAAKQELANWQKNKEDGLAALKERQAVYDAAKQEEPKLIKDLEDAKEALAKAQAATMKAIKDLGLEDALSSDRLDAKLAKYVVMSEATPRGLAEFSQQGKKQAKLVKTLLSDADLMKQMAIADGEANGKYGQAMKIYMDIQKASKKAQDGELQRLALAVSLEHATPRGQRSAVGDTDAPKYVDPLKRYMHFEKAYLADELDPGFKAHSVWDYRMTVDGEEPDEILAWGREMLHNYRPDHISTPDYRWRYVAAVRTDIRYGSQFNKFDKPELQFFQNILMNGGVCGRRAFFGRFILRSFGVPTTARPQPGHAALTHWTPDGWVVCLGGGWGAGTTKGRYTKDRDFLASTQARENDEAFVEVKRAQWMGDVFGEKQVFGLLSGEPGFWYGVSLYRQRKIIEEAKAVALAAVGTDIGEANETKEEILIEKVGLTDEDKAIVVAKDGTITVPAVACSNPTSSTGKILFMDSVLGGKQLHYSRTGGGLAECEYTIAAPKAGTYAVSARVVTPTGDQHLLISVNGATEPVDMVLPLTVGMWDTSEPVEVALVKGKNAVTFSRGGENIRGLTIKDFTLKPVSPDNR